MKKGFASVFALFLALSLAVPTLAAEAESPEQTEGLEEPGVTEEGEPVTDAPEEIAPAPDISGPEESDVFPGFGEAQGEITEPPADETEGLEETNDAEEEPFPDETTEPDMIESPEEVQKPETLIFPDETDPQVETEQEPVIQVTVPQNGNLVINPYGLPVEINGVTTTEKIASSIMTLVNHSNVPVQVDASVTGRFSEGSEVVFLPEPPAPDSQEKELFLYLEFQNSDDGSDHEAWDSAYRDADNQILVSEETVSKQNVLTLEEGEISPTYGVFRLFGGSTMLPIGSWSETDNIYISVAFTFTSLEPEMEAEAESGPKLELETEQLLESKDWTEETVSSEPQADTVYDYRQEEESQPERATDLESEISSENELI